MAVLVIAALSYVLFFHNLGTLVPGYAPREVAVYKASSSLQLIADHPINAPYKLLVFGLQKAGIDNYVATRYVAASFAVVACLLFFIIARFWFSYRIALIATIMFATSSGLLHIARFGSSIVLQMGILALMACAIWWQTYKDKRTVVMLATIVTLATLCYDPGMIWFELLILAVSWQSLRRAWLTTSLLKKGLGALLFLVLIAPLIRGFVLFPASLYSFVGLPAHFAGVAQTGRNILDSLLLVGVHSNGQAELWLAHAPLLNITELVLLFLGLYVFFRFMKPARRLFMFGAIAISLVLIGISGSGSDAGAWPSQFTATSPMNVSVLLPLLYLVIAGGVCELLRQWFRVFPRNPIARGVGGAMIGLLIFFSVVYQYRAYFVAWPNNPATEKVFSIQPKS